MTRENSPAYMVLSPSARRALLVIEKALAGGTSTAISRARFEAEHGVPGGTYRGVIKRIVALGFVDVTHGAPRRVNVFSLSNRWATIDGAEAERLLMATQPRRRGPGRRPQRAAGVSNRASV